VARFPGKVALAEGELDLVVKGVLGADMGALGIGIGTDGAEALKSGQDALWCGQNWDWIGREACPRCLAGLELALEDERRERGASFRANPEKRITVVCRTAGGPRRPSGSTPDLLTSVNNTLCPETGRILPQFGPVAGPARIML
jgi:hypothetical protein